MSVLPHVILGIFFGSRRVEKIVYVGQRGIFFIAQKNEQTIGVASDGQLFSVFVEDFFACGVQFEILMLVGHSLVIIPPE